MADVLVSLAKPVKICYANMLSPEWRESGYLAKILELKRKWRKKKAAAGNPSLKQIMQAVKFKYLSGFGRVLKPA